MSNRWAIIRMVAVGLLDTSGRTDYARLAPPYPRLPDIPHPHPFNSTEEINLWYAERRQTIDNLWKKDKADRDRYWKTVGIAQAAVFAAIMVAIGSATAAIIYFK